MKKVLINVLRVAISVGGLAYVFLTNDWQEVLGWGDGAHKADAGKRNHA